MRPAPRRPALVVALLLLAGVARAQPAVTEAEREFRRGYQALQAGDCVAALVHYRRSLALAPRPRTQFNIAACQEELGQLVEAADGYRAFLARAEARDAAIAATARARLDALRLRLRGRVTLESEPPGAAVQLDGERAPRGVTPLTLALEPGAHVVRIGAGDAAVERAIEVSPASVTALRVELPRPAVIAVAVEPGDAQIALDGGAPVRGRLEVAVRPGRHLVALRRPGFVDEQLAIDAVAGRSVEQRVRLRAAPVTTALVIRGIAGATVRLDGRAVGATADAGGLTIAGVAVGVRELRVERAGRVPWRGTVAIDPGEAVEVALRLPPTPTPTRASLRWGLRGAGVAGIAAGGVVGVLALRDVASPIAADHDRGKTRALIADALFVVGSAALIAAWRLGRGRAATATIHRTRGAP